MQSDKTRAQQLAERVIELEHLPRPEIEPTKPTGPATNVLCGDNDVPSVDRAEYKTPLFMLDKWETHQRGAFGNSPPTMRVRCGYKKWTDTAHLEVEEPGLLTSEGMHLHFSVTCNPEYMSLPKDLVPVYLETSVNNFVVTVIVLEPTWEVNYWDVEVTYSLEQLAKVLGIDLRGDRSAIDQIGSRYRELGLRAQWMGVQGQALPQVNGVKHESGGLDQKNGSGKIRLFPYTLEELKGSEGKRNVSWNMAENLNAGRPIFQAFPDIFQPDKPMMTTLEAESEFMLNNEEDLDHVIDAMHKLTKNEEQLKRYGITKMTAKPKLYVDSYFDLPELPLLTNKIVLRRRHATTDLAGTYLFAVKGATYVKSGGRERLRLAAQVHLVEDTMTTERGRGRLREFLSNGQVDNAFSRVLHHGLSGAPEVVKQLAVDDIFEAIVVTSKRETFQMTLADGTVIDFSADKAKAEFKGETCWVYSFEFGVGHPALTNAGMGGPVNAGGSGGSVKDRMKQFQAPKAEIVRPYHVPDDLRNDEIFALVDYGHFMKLRNALVTEVFGFSLDALTVGGSKANVLAKELGMIKKD